MEFSGVSSLLLIVVDGLMEIRMHICMAHDWRLMLEKAAVKKSDVLDGYSNLYVPTSPPKVTDWQWRVSE